MANSTTPFGLRPIRRLDGAPLNFQTRRVFVPASDSTAIFVGDLVKPVAMVTTGNINQFPTVAQYTVGAANTSGVVVAVDPIAGVAVGSENLTRLYRPASTAMELIICDDPNLVFLVRTFGTLAGTAFRKNAEIAAGPAGSTITGMSGMVLQASTAATTATLPMRILNWSQQTDNEIAVGAALVEVALNTLPIRSQTGI
jgi:hypothetical protein